MTGLSKCFFSKELIVNYTGIALLRQASRAMAPRPCFRKSNTSKDGWHYLEHGYDEIVDRLSTKFRGRNDYEKDVESYLFDRGLDYIPCVVRETTLDDLGVLKLYFAAFSRIYFDGQLTLLNCPLSMVYKKPTPGAHGTRWESSYHGFTEDHRKRAGTSPSNVQSPIYILEMEHTNPNVRLRMYIGTLLHEMVHAFFHLFACGCPRCVNPSQAPLLFTEGNLGHGLPFMKLALTFEKFAVDKLGLRIDLGLAYSFALDRKEGCSGITFAPNSKIEADFNLKSWGNYQAEQVSHYLEYLLGCRKDKPRYKEYPFSDCGSDDVLMEDEFSDSEEEEDGISEDEDTIMEGQEDPAVRTLHWAIKTSKSTGISRLVLIPDPTVSSKDVSKYHWEVPVVE